MFKTKKIAFTLLELLIVIAMLAILSGAVYLIINPKKNITRLLKKEEARVELFASSKN